MSNEKKDVSKEREASCIARIIGDELIGPVGVQQDVKLTSGYLMFQQV